IANFSSNLVAQRATSTLNIKTAGINPPSLPASYPIAVTGTSGGLTRSARVNLLLNSPGGFTVSASPSTLSILKGTSGQTTLTVVPSGGFIGVVQFAVSGLPTGVTTTFTPGSVTGSGTSTLALKAATTAASGTSTITVTATSGTIVRTTTVTLTIS